MLDDVLANTLLDELILLIKVNGRSGSRIAAIEACSAQNGKAC